MNKEKIEIAKLWFRKAKNDLTSAEKLSSGDNPVLDTAIYHCQQAAEKTLKGFLVFHEIEFSKTHDLRTLINLASKMDNSIKELENAAESLTPYAVEYRYPDDIMEPDEDEFNDAFNYAKNIYEFILNKLIFQFEK
ncbi:MAG: HEPN domain-containing protein [Ignavibacteriae bacterium]|nr:HEPN domain-containing protein [Ignavibacteriota bacterium]